MFSFQGGGTIQDEALDLLQQFTNEAEPDGQEGDNWHLHWFTFKKTIIISLVQLVSVQSFLAVAYLFSPNPTLL